MTASALQKKRKKYLKRLIIALVILAIFWFGYSKFTPTQEAPNYITATAHIADIENNVMASGKVKALNTVNVGAQVSGEVTKLYVDVGDVVRQGDLIAQIDQVTQKNNLSNQEATLRQSQAALDSARADYMSREANLKSAQADLASRQAELRQTQNDLKRLSSLLDVKAISEQEFDAAKTNVETTVAKVASANAAIHAANAALITANANITSNIAALQKAQTDLDTAKENLGYTTIRAPIDGTVVSVVAEQGTTVNANQSAPTIVTLADLSTVRINAQISEADVINVQAGMPVYFNIIGNPDEKFTGVLTAIEPAPEQISSTSSTNSAVYYVGYIEVPNPDKRFRIDMTAQVFIIIDQAKEALLIPSVALHKGTPPADIRLQTEVQSQSEPQSESQSESQSEPEKTAQSTPPQQAINRDPQNNEDFANHVINSHVMNSEVMSSANSQHYVRMLNADGSVHNQGVTVGIDNRVDAQIIAGLQAGDKVILSEEDSEEGGNRPYAKPGV